MSYKSAYDKVNVPQFNKGGQNFGYVCSICGQMTTIDDSASCEGYNLVCMRCIYKIGNLTGISIGEFITKLHDEGNKKRSSEPEQEE